MTADDDKSNLETKLRETDRKNTSLQENLDKVQMQMGVPQKQFN